ncbi:MAG: pyrroline-5-carboxylate reductase [Prevotellaceae bacterium]|jgi:pyrroline-5-carboxylate reductase|nr:pyrroline-5-carboxylate reductase [Prevotellaceae bacterium]
MKITVIGAGNIGGAILEGTVGKGILQPADITASDPHPHFEEKFLRKNIAAHYTADNVRAIQGADLVIVAVKPWLVEKVMGEIASALDRKKQAVVSIAAGVTFDRLEQYLSSAAMGGLELYRVIPNTAISLGRSVSFITRRHTSAAHDEQVRTLFAALGEVFDVEESEMTACTALSSAGIAYALRYLDAAMQGGAALGLDVQKSLRIVMKTMDGALALLEANGASPQAEIDKVTTPGGVTLKGLDAMENGGFTRAVIDGLLATR